MLFVAAGFDGGVDGIADGLAMLDGAAIMIVLSDVDFGKLASSAARSFGMVAGKMLDGRRFSLLDLRWLI